VSKRVRFVGLALGTMAVGLGVHWHGGVLGAGPRDILGDALWAAMIVWWIGALAPGAGLRTRGITAFGICCAVEFSQAVHTAALDALRETTVGHLVLGSGFDPRDFVSYALGVLAATLLDWRVNTYRRQPPSTGV